MLFNIVYLRYTKFKQNYPLQQEMLALFSKMLKCEFQQSFPSKTAMKCY